MHFVTVPRPVKATAPSLAGNDIAVEVTLAILIEWLSTSKAWREDDAAMANYVAVADAFEGREIGSIVTLEDSEYEALVRVFKGFDFHQNLTNAALRVFRAVTSAPKKDPRMASSEEKEK